MKNHISLVASFAAFAVAGFGGGSPANADDAGTANGPTALDASGTCYVRITSDNKVEVRRQSDPATADPVAQFNAPRDQIQAVAISADDAYVAIATDNREIGIWSVQDRKKVATLEEPRVTKERVGETAVSNVTSLAFNAKGTELALADHGYCLVGRYVGSDPSSFTAGGAFYTSAPLCSITSDNRGAWIGGDDAGRLHFFDWSNREIGATGSKVAGAITALAMSPDGNQLVTSGNDNEVKVWAIPGGALGASTHLDEVKLVDRRPAGVTVASVAFRSTGMEVAYADAKSKISDWQYTLASPSPAVVVAATASPATPPVATTPPVTPAPVPTTPAPVAVTPAPPAPTNPVAVVTPPVNPPATTTTAPTAPPAAPAAENPAQPHPEKAAAPRVGTVSAASLPPPLHVRLNVQQVSKMVGHTEYVNGVVFSPDGRELASVSRDKTVRLWDVADGSQKAILGRHDGYASAIAFSPDGKTLASGGWDDKIKLFNLTTDKEEQADAKLDKHTSYVLSLDFSPDGTRIASGSNDRTARIFNAATGASRSTPALPDAVASVAFSPDGSMIAGGCLDGSVIVWDAASMKAVRTLKPESGTEPVFCVEFMDNGEVVAGGKAGSLRVWNVHTGLMTKLPAGTQDIYSVAFDGPKGLLAAGGADKLIRFWSADAIRNAKPGTHFAPMLVQGGHSNTVRTLAFSPDGSLLASGSWDDTIRVWSVAEKTGYADNLPQM